MSRVLQADDERLHASLLFLFEIGCQNFTADSKRTSVAVSIAQQAAGVGQHAERVGDVDEASSHW